MSHKRLMPSPTENMVIGRMVPNGRGSADRRRVRAPHVPIGSTRTGNGGPAYAQGTLSALPTGALDTATVTTRRDPSQIRAPRPVTMPERIDARTMRYILRDRVR